VIRVFGLQTAKEMFFTARPISAEKAVRMGALNHLVKAEELESFTYEMATSICNNSPVSVTVAKRQINAIAQSTALSTSTFELIEELRLRAFSSQDYFEGRKAFNEKRTPNFTGE
jgi:methylmalonyl-CoA decarboxylase